MNRLPKTLSKLITAVLCLFATSVLAQTKQFKYRAALPKVDSAAYYRINLQSALTAKAKDDLSDIRILNGAGQFVAYVKVGDFPPDAPSKRLIAFPQEKNFTGTDSSTVFAVENPTGSVTDHLTVWLKNTLAQRSISISGSDDLKQWFAVTDHAELGTATAQDKSGQYQQELSFPPTSYRYLKLTILNGRNAPLSIVQAGIYTRLQVTLKFVPIALSFKQADSANHITHVYINFDQPYTINKLYLKVKGDIYFHREINVYRNNRTHEWLTSKTFSNQDMEINLAVKIPSLDIQIVNNDDQPLPIEKVEAYQSENYIVAKLEPGKPYYLLAGADSVQAPKYDLQFFTEKIGKHLPEIAPLAVEANPDYKTTVVAKPTAAKNYWIWIAIAAAVTILSGLTFSMTREVKKRES